MGERRKVKWLFHTLFPATGNRRFAWKHEKMVKERWQGVGWDWVRGRLATQRLGHKRFVFWS